MSTSSTLHVGAIAVTLAALLACCDARAAVTMSADDDQTKNFAVQIPTRPCAALFESQPGVASTEIHYDPDTRRVAINFAVQDPHGYFIPNIRRENFVVYENGVRQENASVEVEHSPISFGVLLESGGRYPSLNDAMSLAVTNAADQLLKELDPDDKVAVWRYGDKLEPVADFTSSRDAARHALNTLPTPYVSELNFYDAMLGTLKELRPVSGRKALRHYLRD